MIYHGKIYSAQVARRRMEVGGMVAGAGGAVAGFFVGGPIGAVGGWTAAAAGAGALGHSAAKK